MTKILRVMEWNIWQGGREAGGDENIRQLIEFICRQQVDILFLLETYGTGPRLLAALNEDHSGDDMYTGVQITKRPEKDRDNLWIYTRFPVVHHFPTVTEGELTSFNFGGIKVQLPGGQRLNLFNTWLWHAPGAWRSVHNTVGEMSAGKQPSMTPEEMVATDMERRHRMAEVLLQERLPSYLVDDDDPIILAGDLNTLSYLDWGPQFAHAPGHGGLVLPWPVTKMFHDAGFVDVYRDVHADAGKHPGQTWSPEYGYGNAPGRIDYIFIKGSGLRARDAYVLDERLPGHEHPKHRFYSDHAAVMAELEVVE